MEDDSSRDGADTIEHLKFEVVQEYGLNQNIDKKSKKNIKNS